MTSHWALVEYVARVLPREEREPVLGDMMEANDSAWDGLRGIAGLLVRRQTELWKSWRPWLAGFGVALPSSFCLMGLSLSVALSYMRLYCPEMLAQVSMTKPAAMLVLLWQALLLIGWSWTGGFVVGSLSKRTLWVSTALCYAPCLLCLSRFGTGAMSRYCLLLFLLPGVWGVHQGFRISRIKFSHALCIALALTLLIVPTWGSSWLQTRIPQNALLAWVLSTPAWYLVFTAWKRRRESQVEHAG